MDGEPAVDRGECRRAQGTSGSDGQANKNVAADNGVIDRTAEEAGPTDQRVRVDAAGGGVERCVEEPDLNGGKNGIADRSALEHDGPEHREAVLRGDAPEQREGEHRDREAEGAGAVGAVGRSEEN